jgi:hypothetical protein
LNLDIVYDLEFRISSLIFMQQFIVPQFIDVEAKIIGPITARQFVIMLSGVVLGAVFYKIFDFSLFLTAAILDLIIVGIFSFVKINARPFHLFIINFLETLKKPKLRVWNNAIFNVNVRKEEEEAEKTAQLSAPSLKRPTQSRLAELSLIVDTGGAYRGEEGESEISIK